MMAMAANGWSSSRWRGGALAVLALLVIALFLAPGSVAQDPPPLPPPPDPANLTGDPGLHTPIQIVVETENAFARIPENGLARYTVVVKDISIAGTQAYAPEVIVTCDPINQTEGARNWGFTEGTIPPMSNGKRIESEFMIISGLRPSPEYFSVTFECHAGPPANEFVGRFTLRAQVEEYVYMAYAAVNTIPPVAPDSEVEFTVRIQNNGNFPKRYVGRIDAGPGWDFPAPPAVVIPPGESQEITITGISPRDKLIYISGNDAVQIAYWPDGAEGKALTAFFPVTVKGVYLHPALLPMTLLALVIVGSLVFLAILTRRAIEEQILGKPVPPWRIPVEREYLQQLEKDDPDQFYVVRYYLMVEEHDSALLWFHAYKRATKKDRKRERTWVKVQRRQERKVRGVEKGHARVEKKWDRKMKRVEKKRDRGIRKLERKLRRKERTEARTVGKKHKKRVKKIEKKHRKRFKRSLKKWEKLVAKETKKAERRNRKLEKKGEEPLPLPVIPAPELGDPDLPEMKAVEERPLEESKYASRADRLRERAERHTERLRVRAEKHVNKDRLRADAKIERLRAKIPPQPMTELHETTEFVSAQDAIVEDDRSLLSRMLHIPTLEEREQERRRRGVHLARIKEAKAAGDDARVRELDAQYMVEKAKRKEARYAQESLAKAGALEAKRLREAEKRRAKELAKERASDAPSDADAATDHDRAAAPPARPSGFRLKIGQKGTARAPPTATADAPPGTQEPASSHEGVLARFRKRKSSEAGSEETKKVAAESSTDGPSQGHEE